MGFIGAGFVIGIRLVSEWFPANQLGTAEGIYAGWGNFGSAAAAMSLPTLALMFGGDDGWRYAIASTGLLAFCYGIFFWFRARNTPKGSTYFKPKKSGGLEVSSWGDLYLYIAMTLPLYIALAVLSWKLSPVNLGLLNQTTTNMMYLGLSVLFVFQVSQIWRVNKDHLRAGVPEIEKYKFKQVAALDWAYFVTFGSELAVVSMLPLFFMETFELSAVTAGLLASGFAFMNLVARPGGGYLSDTFGRKRSLTILISGLTIGYLVLAQVDSSVGGKTAINSKAGKNLIGAFHQPAMVLIDPKILESLPPREFAAGIAEVVKYGLIDDADFFDWCESNMQQFLAGDLVIRSEAITRSVSAKARIVAEDEKELTGKRALLNLGHTFGHALEAETGFSDRLLHGEGVACGMTLAFRYSARLGLCGDDAAQRISELLARADLPTTLKQAGCDVDGQKLVDHMLHDKKMSGGTLPFLLARGIGETFLSAEVDLADVAEFLNEERAR